MRLMVSHGPKGSMEARSSLIMHAQWGGGGGRTKNFVWKQQEMCEVCVKSSRI